MKIHYNEIFECYESTDQDLKFGKQITLDGVELIPRSKIDKAIEKIKDMGFGIQAEGWEVRDEIIEVIKRELGE